MIVPVLRYLSIKWRRSSELPGTDVSPCSALVRFGEDHCNRLRLKGRLGIPSGSQFGQVISSDAAVHFWLNSVGCCVGTRASTWIVAY